MNETKYSSKRRVLLEINELISFHLSTQVDKRINKKREIKHFYEVYKKIEHRIFKIETYIRSIEQKEKYEYYDLLLLSNYKHLINAQKVFFELFNYVYQHIINTEFIKYSKLKNYENKLGVATLDFINFYNINNAVNISWEKELKAKIISNYGEFYYNYFIFKLIYFLILNLNIEENKKAYDNYIEVCYMLKKVMIDFNHN